MKQVENISGGTNFTAITVGNLSELSNYVLTLSPEVQIPGKVFLAAALNTTGAEISLQSFAVGSQTGFLHKHKNHEEIYIFIAGKGEFQVNGVLVKNAQAADVVDMICKSWLGKVGAVIAILGVVICPITSGDTAFRSLRLSIADFLKVDQKPISKRLLVSLPVFVLAFFFCKVDFSTAWSYLGIANQILATLVLWTGAAYLISKGRAHWMCSLPATFLTFICVSFLFIAPLGLGLAPMIGYIAGVIVAIPTLIFFIIKGRKSVTLSSDMA